ncbi:hypothetical protein SAMN02745126_02735 [Enhydrobacter aerosaccus]|uniref:Uncharacterized protein n=1 Tax=Enhydrobacter aerosaccus TaxID=225324 RepID=A0A1T4PC44_9HYPH|nr:hypothetical protein [Enhydrobacter aerosaccus]SJZ89123.1 hypothetical protein SAMN02745126_02735 [Enhydrobacter aerosaccus]
MSWSGELLKHAAAMRKMAAKVRGLAEELKTERRRLLGYAKTLERDADLLEAKAGGRRQRRPRRSTAGKAVAGDTPDRPAGKEGGYFRASAPAA